MAISIYTTLISKINNTLDTVNEIKQRFNYPASKISKYPCVIVFPDNFENEFETINENIKIYRFKMYLIIDLLEGLEEEIWTIRMPALVDAVLAQFDADWDSGNIDGHRVWFNIDNGSWENAKYDKGVEAIAELNLYIKLLTTNNS